MTTASSAIGRQPARHARRSLAARIRGRYFKSGVDTAVTLVAGTLLLVLAIDLFDWAVIDSVWEASSALDCAARGSGACWAVLPARIRLVLFGVYPFEEQWRAALGCLVLLTASVLSCMPAFWSIGRLAPLWLGSFSVYLLLLRGGLFGLSVVTTENWGGLALTFLIFASVMLVGLPAAILLAMARTSALSWLRFPAGVLVDFIRSVPLIAVLFTAAIVAPLVLPAWMSGDKLTRVIIGAALFFAVYQAEILRGGFQAIPSGQREAATALGLRYWQYQFTVILPQVFRTVLPQTINQAVSGFKDTSYVAVVGFFDMTASASAALGTGDWALAFIEIYAVVGAIYLIFGYSLSRYGHYLEQRMGAAYRY